MYINFWYPIAKSKEITTYQPFKTKVLMMNLVAFRDTDGKPVVLSDTCIHRGGSLGDGKIKKGQVECPYHGWMFDKAGTCTHIPTVEETPPARAKVDSYPTQEKYGIVFAFLGDLPEAERPPLYEMKEYEVEPWRANDVVVFELDAYYERSIENGLDPAHNEFVHPLQGGPSIAQSIKDHPIDVKDTSEWGSAFLQPFGSEGAHEDKKIMGAGEGTTRAGSEHYGPNAMITRIWFSETRKFHQFLFEAPIDGNRTRIFLITMRNWMLEDENDQRLIDINLTIAEEDIKILKTLDPVRTPSSNTKELLVPADKPVFRYREFLDEWEKKGWKIDRRAYEDQKGDVAFAIPCPARRESKSWVLDAMPLIK